VCLALRLTSADRLADADLDLDAARIAVADGFLDYALPVREKSPSVQAGRLVRRGYGLMS
jgi:hypothetical protein